MATKKKLLQAAAGNAGGEALNVEDVFSTYLYDGTGAAQTITNGIDLDGEGGLVWVKGRDQARENVLQDTERGTGVWMSSNLNNGNISNAQMINQFNSDGFRVGTESDVNFSGEAYASWTFRKAPKFFTCLTYTGNSTNRTISHDLGSAPGMLIVKRTDNPDGWFVYHRSLGATKGIMLNQTYASITTGRWQNTAPTATEFSIFDDDTVNASGATYVAYLFAHNDDDGEFGADGDADIIKCGSWTGSGSSGTQIDLGFEPQWVMLKQISGSAQSGWAIFDVMRGMNQDTNTRLMANANDTESSYTSGNVPIALNATGFKVKQSYFYDSGNAFIYIAIRRGTKVPESATEVFEVFETTNTGTASTIGSMGPSDFILNKRTDAAATWRAIDRLRGGSMLRTDSTDTETSASNFLEWDKMGGVFVTTQGAPYITNDSQAHWMWKRAPGYFDVVAYSGDGTLNQTFNHNLTVKPDMVWIKNRGRTQDWWVALDDSIVNLDGRLNSSGDFGYSVIGTFTDTTVQTLNQNQFATNYSGDTYIAYLFASLDGISKVGSYTGTGATLNIDCGFTSGARFVFLKRTDAAGQWLTFDSERGITLANSPVLFLNSDSAEDSGYDIIDPYSSGFTVTADATYEQNISGGSYIFYAIA